MRKVPSVAWKAKEGVSRGNSQGSSWQANRQDCYPPRAVRTWGEGRKIRDCLSNWLKPLRHLQQPKPPMPQSACYQLVTSSMLNEFNHKISEMLAQGWTLYGCPFSYQVGISVWYGQALTK